MHIIFLDTWYLRGQSHLKMKRTLRIKFWSFVTCAQYTQLISVSSVFHSSMCANVSGGFRSTFLYVTSGMSCSKYFISWEFSHTTYNLLFFHRWILVKLGWHGKFENEVVVYVKRWEKHVKSTEVVRINHTKGCQIRPKIYTPYVRRPCVILQIISVSYDNHTCNGREKQNIYISLKSCTTAFCFNYMYIK